MRELWNKLSDYLNERRNCPERREDRLSAAVTCAAAVAVIVLLVLLLLVLWGRIAKDRRQSDEEEAQDVTVSEVHEEEAAEYMAAPSGQDRLKQEYLEEINELDSEVTRLLESFARIEERLSESMENARKGDASLKEQVAALYAQLIATVKNLKQMQTQLYDLTDLIQVMSDETVPIIQEQIAGIQGDMDKVRADIAGLSDRIEALEKEDTRLWAELEAVRDMISGLSIQALQYRYEPETMTLYLEPSTGLSDTEPSTVTSGPEAHN